MDYGRAFIFMFEDPEWISKVLIGGLLILVGSFLSVLLVGVLILLPVSGYMLRLVRQMMNGEGDTLPTWSDFGDLMAEGFKVAAALFIWVLPLIALEIPVWAGSALAGRDNSISLFFGLITASCSCILFLYSIILALASPLIILQVAKEGRFGAAFDFDAMWGLFRRHTSEIIVIVILYLVIELIAGIVGLLLLFIGVFFTAMWAALAYSHLIGQLGQLDAPSTLAALPPEGPAE